MRFANCCARTLNAHRLFFKEGIMNTEQFKQSWGQLEGHLKKHWEKLTDDDLLKIEGDLDQFNGAIEKR